MTDRQPQSERRGRDDDGHDVLEPLYVAVLTISSSRDAADDPGGDLAASLIDDHGHVMTHRRHAEDDAAAIVHALADLVAQPDVDCVVTTGGTGVTPDDVTPETCAALFDRHLPGFGELFRLLSYEDIGHRAMASRATAGIVSSVPVFCLPGSTGAVRTGMTELILPEAPHLAGLATRTS